jgi:protein-tyrosine phosphatase
VADQDSGGRVRVYNRRIEILTVCTGNVCRSPMAEAFLRRDLAALGVEAVVSSAGTLRDGMAAAEEVVELMGKRGIDVELHRSRRLAPDMLASADLVIGMTRDHVREAALLDFDCFARSFTLKEIVRRGQTVGPRRADEPLEAWLKRAGEGREPRDYLFAEDDDIDDPMGRRFSVFKRTAIEIESLTTALVALLFAAA